MSDVKVILTDEVRGGKQKSQFRVTLVLPEEEA